MLVEGDFTACILTHSYCRRNAGIESNFPKASRLFRAPENYKSVLDRESRSERPRVSALPRQYTLDIDRWHFTCDLDF